MELFLTSSVNVVAKDIAQRINAQGKKLAFIYTAAEAEVGGLNADWCQADRHALTDIGFAVTDYTITNKKRSDLENDLSEFEVIYVSGGNTFYLLQQAQKSGFIEIIKDLVNRGVLYIGSSAGSCIAGPNIYPTRSLDNPDVASELSDYAGLKLVNFLVLPHWGSDDFRDGYAKLTELSYSSDQVPMIILTDYQYVWVKDGKFEIVEVNNESGN